MNASMRACVLPPILESSGVCCRVYMVGDCCAASGCADAMRRKAARPPAVTHIAPFITVCSLPTPRTAHDVAARGMFGRLADSAAGWRRVNSDWRNWAGVLLHLDQGRVHNFALSQLRGVLVHGQVIGVTLHVQRADDAS